MKTELNSPIKLKIPFEIFETYKEDNDFPYSKLFLYIKDSLDFEDGELLDVSKIWITEKTDMKLDELNLKYLKYLNKVKKININKLKKDFGFYKLQYGPAVDYYDSFNLLDDYIYVEEDVLSGNII